MIVALLETAPGAASVADIRFTLPVHVIIRGSTEVVRILVWAFPRGTVVGRDFHGRAVPGMVVRSTTYCSRGRGKLPSMPDHGKLIDYLQGLALESLKRALVHL